MLIVVRAHRALVVERVAQRGQTGDVPVLLFIGVRGQGEQLDQAAGDVHAGVG